jgi:hypothetical protein
MGNIKSSDRSLFFPASFLNTSVALQFGGYWLTGKPQVGISSQHPEKGSLSYSVL